MPLAHGGVPLSGGIGWGFHFPFGSLRRYLFGLLGSGRVCFQKSSVPSGEWGRPRSRFPLFLTGFHFVLILRRFISLIILSKVLSADFFVAQLYCPLRLCFK